MSQDLSALLVLLVCVTRFESHPVVLVCAGGVSREQRTVAAQFVPPSPVQILQATPRLAVLLLFFADVAARVFRTAVLFAVFHQPFTADLFFRLGVVVCVLLPLVLGRTKVLVGMSDCGGRTFFAMSLTLCYIVLPWTLLSSPMTWPSFSRWLFWELFLVDVVAISGVVAWLAFAPPSRAASYLGPACVLDVVGVCSTCEARASRFPQGIVMAFAATLGAAVLMWLCAAWVVWRRPSAPVA